MSLLLERAPVRNTNFVSKLRNHHLHARELWEQGWLAAELGALGPDIKLDEVPNDVFLCLKFPVLQRSSSDEFEVRACADASSGAAGNRYNELWVPPEKVTMSDSETVLAELALAARLHGKEVQGCKRDLRKAYWQVPRSQEGPRIFMIFWHAPSGDVRARELFSEDFGAAGAVWCCNRVFKALVLVLQWTTTLTTTGCSLLRGQCNQLALCWIGQLRFWAIIGRRKSTIQLCRFPCWVCPLMLSTAKRFARTREKSSTPNEFNLSSVVGKLVFSGKGLCGRAGVHARRPLYQAFKDFSIHRQAGVWPAHVLEAIAVCAGTLFSAPPRTLHLDRWQWPSAVSYGDAALSTRRIAAISVQVPQTFLESLSPSGHEDLAINGFEAYWVNRACDHWVDFLRFKLVLIFL